MGKRRVAAPAKHTGLHFYRCEYVTLKNGKLQQPLATPFVAIIVALSIEDALDDLHSRRAADGLVSAPVKVELLMGIYEALFTVAAEQRVSAQLESRKPAAVHRNSRPKRL
jgi:hypothetical protein